MNNDIELQINKTINWLREQVKKAGARGLIVGVSGGIDSALVCFLIKKAFPANSLGVILPCDSYPQDRDCLLYTSLSELNASNKEQLIVFNKLDIKSKELDYIYPTIKNNKIKISALTGEGINDLLKKIEEKLSFDKETITLIIPYDKGNLISFLHQKANILNKEYTDNGVLIKVEIKSTYIDEFKDYIN